MGGVPYVQQQTGRKVGVRPATAKEILQRRTTFFTQNGASLLGLDTGGLVGASIPKLMVKSKRGGMRDATLQDIGRKPIYTLAHDSTTGNRTVQVSVRLEPEVVPVGKGTKLGYHLLVTEQPEQILGDAMVGKAGRTSGRQGHPRGTTHSRSSGTVEERAGEAAGHSEG